MMSKRRYRFNTQKSMKEKVIRYRQIVIYIIILLTSYNVKSQISKYDSLINYAQQHLHTQPKQTIPALKQSLELAKAEDDAEKISRSVLGLSIASLTTEQYTEAYDILNSFLEDYETRVSDKNLAKIYKSIGDLLYSTDAYEESLEYYHKSYEIVKSKTNDPVSGKLLLNIGAIYKIFGDNKQANKNFKASLKIAMKNKDTLAQVYVKSAIADAHFNAKSNDSADFYYQKVLQLSKLIGYGEGKTISYIGLSKIAISNNDLLLAEGYLNKAYNQPGIRNYDKISIYLGLADIARKKLDYLKAHNILLKANKLADSLNSLEMKSLTTKELSNIEVQLGNTEEAYKNLNSYLVLKDSIASKELGFKILSKEFSLNTKNRKEIHKKEKYLIYSLSISIILLLLSITLITIFHLKRLKLKVKNQKLKIELHNATEQKLQLDISQKNSILSEKMLKLTASEKFNNELLSKLKELKNKSKQEQNTQIKDLISNYKTKNINTFWNEFQLYFTQTHPAFYDRLNKDFPNLTANERKLCAFIKLNMSIKDVSSITMQSENAIKVARARLRKKLNISDRGSNKGISLVEFINKY